MYTSTGPPSVSTSRNRVLYLKDGRRWLARERTEYHWFILSCDGNVSVVFHRYKVNTRIFLGSLEIKFC